VAEGGGGGTVELRRGVVEVVMVFRSFSRWLEVRRGSFLGLMGEMEKMEFLKIKLWKVVEHFRTCIP